MELMGDVVGCSVVHRLSANSNLSTTPVVTALATAAVATAAVATLAATSLTPALPSKIDRMVPFGVGREL